MCRALVSPSHEPRRSAVRAPGRARGAARPTTTTSSREFDAAASPQAVLRDAAAAARKRIELSHLVDRYRAGKADDGVMDFSDQMAWGATLGRSCPRSARCCASGSASSCSMSTKTRRSRSATCSRRCSPALTRDGRGFRSPPSAIPAQAIYGWRGAAVGNLEHFLDDFPARRRRSRASVQPHRDATVRSGDHRRRQHVVAAVLRHVRGGQTADSASRPRDGRRRRSTPPSTTRSTAMVEVASRLPAGPLRDIAILVRVAARTARSSRRCARHDIPFEIVGLEGLLSSPRCSTCWRCSRSSRTSPPTRRCCGC